MVLNGEAVGLILDPRHQTESLGMGVDGHLCVAVPQCPGPVPVVLDHAADRDIQIQLLQDPEGDVDLPAAAVHHDQIRQLHEMVVLLLQRMGQSSCQHLPHGGVIIGSGHSPDPEFPVIALLRASVLKNNHGTYRFHAACI